MASRARGCGPRLPKDAEELWKGAEQAEPELGPRRATGDTPKVAAGYLGHLGYVSSSVPLQNRQGREHPTSTLIPMIFLQEKPFLHCISSPLCALAWSETENLQKQDPGKRFKADVGSLGQARAGPRRASKGV